MTRIAMLANLAAVVAGAQRLPAGGAPAASRPLDGQPNIVIILADDMGFSDAGCYGSQIATPNLDRLAATGLRFTQLYNTTRCCPTRAALLTGLYPHQCGIGHMTDDRGVPGYRGRLNEHCVTIAEVLRQSGYHTWMSGKWHLGMERTQWPIEHGFERYFGQLSGACNYFRPEPGRVMALDDSVYRSFGDHFYITDGITDYAVRFLDGADRDARPFFLYVAYTAPHAPLHAWPSDIAKYRGKYRIGWDAVRQRRYERMIELGIIERAWALSPRPPEVPAWEAVTDPDEQDLRMSVYAAQIDRMDQGIGRILDRIRRLGMEHSTLVMFLSDNGGDSEDIDEGKPGAPVGTADSYRGYAPPWANVSNAPFRRYKRQVHEGGIATPLIVRWPAVVRRGDGLRHAPGHVIDLMPTCLDAAGVKYPARWDDHDITPTPGRSLLPVFRGEAAGAHDCLFWEHEGNWAVRCGNFKLVAVEGGEPELYDLAADRTEMHNLAAQRPDVVKSLRGKYDEWARQCNVVPWDKLPARVPKQPNGSS